MRKRNIIIGVCGVIALSIVIGGTYLLGNKQGANAMTIRRATPYELAEAMKGDYFYSSYRENTLAVAGTVASVSHSGSATTVGFVSDSSYHVACVFNDSPSNIGVGSKLNVVTEGHSAVRNPNGVTLKNCLEL